MPNSASAVAGHKPVAYGAVRQTEAAPVQAQRLNNFDAIRMLAALSVLISHQYALTGLAEPMILGVATLGGLGVMVFFSISGFLVAQSWMADPCVWRFLLKRLLRIWPALAIVVVLSAVVMGAIVSTLSAGEYFAHPLFRAYFRNLHFMLSDKLPMQFSGNAKPDWINGSLWTIPLELKCYVALCALGLLGGFKRVPMLPLLALAGATAYFMLLPQIAHIGFLRWLPDKAYVILLGLFFLAGAALQRFSYRTTRRRPLTVPLLFSCLACGIAVVARQPMLALWLAVPSLTVAAGQAATPFLRRFGRFGDLSYGMYLYAFPVQQLLIWIYKDRLPWSAMLCMSVLLTAMCAFFSWHFVEKWALRWKPHKPPMRGAVLANVESGCCSSGKREPIQ